MTKEEMREYDRIRNSTQERKEYLKLYSQTPEVKKRAKERYKRTREQRRLYRQSAHYKLLEAKWESAPQRIAWKKAYRESEHAKEISRNSRLKKVFGISVSDYDRLLGSQNGVCAICLGLQPNGIRLAVDHCHKSNKVRGLLCGKCNRAVGLLRDSSSNAGRASEYLKRYGF